MLLFTLHIGNNKLPAIGWHTQYTGALTFEHVCTPVCRIWQMLCGHICMHPPPHNLSMCVHRCVAFAIYVSDHKVHELGLKYILWTVSYSQRTWAKAGGVPSSWPRNVTFSLLQGATCGWAAAARRHYFWKVLYIVTLFRKYTGALTFESVYTYIVLCIQVHVSLSTYIYIYNLCVCVCVCLCACLCACVRVWM